MERCNLKEQATYWFPDYIHLIELFLLNKAAWSSTDKWRWINIKVISYKVQKGFIVEFVQVQT